MTASVRPHLDGPEPKRRPEPCAVCGGTPREYKPVCSDHLDSMPYVARLLDGEPLGKPDLVRAESSRLFRERRRAQRVAK